MDSRVSRPIGVKPTPFGPGEPIFCISCGAQEGYVTLGLPPGVFAVCSACEAKFGMPEEMFQKVEVQGHESV